MSSPVRSTWNWRPNRPVLVGYDYENGRLGLIVCGDYKLRIECCFLSAPPLTHARDFFLCSFCAQREEVRRFLCVLSLGWNFLEMERDFLGLMSSSSKDVCIDHGKMNIIWFFLAIFGFRIIGCVWCLCVIWNVYSKRLISQSFRDDSTFSRKSQELLSFLSFPFFIYLFLWNCLFLLGKFHITRCSK